MIKRLTLMTILVATAVAADADTKKQETYTFSARAFQTIALEHPVGDLEVRVGRGDEIVVRMKVECSSWRNRCSSQAERIEVVSSERGSVLALKVDGFPKKAESISVDLDVTLPARLSLEVERGVGETRIGGVEGNIRVEAGVGEVRVKAPVSAFGRVVAECGVGEADLDVPEGRVKQDGFLFLGNEISWRGDGPSTIEVEVGVGSAEIDLE